VLESVQVVQQQGNEKFIWLGGSGVSLALINLSCKVNMHQRPYEV
jgi:cellobiose-specific phosphotransferase system component IIC